MEFVSFELKARCINFFNKRNKSLLHFTVWTCFFVATWRCWLILYDIIVTSSYSSLCLIILVRLLRADLETIKYQLLFPWFSVVAIIFCRAVVLNPFRFMAPLRILTSCDPFSHNAEPRALGFYKATKINDIPFYLIYFQPTVCLMRLLTSQFHSQIRA